VLFRSQSERWYKETVPYYEYQPELERFVEINVEHLYLTYRFFENLDFNDSIIFMSACHSFNDPLKAAFLKTCNTYIGADKDCSLIWSDMVSYLFFYYMINGFGAFPDYNYSPPKPKTYISGEYYPYYPPVLHKFEPLTDPMSVDDVYKKLQEYNFTIDQNEYLTSDGEPDSGNGWETKMQTHNPNTYFPAPSLIIIYED